MSNTIYPNWFDMTARENFSRFLLPEAGKDGYRALQVGAYHLPTREAANRIAAIYEEVMS